MRLGARTARLEHDLMTKKRGKGREKKRIDLPVAAHAPLRYEFKDSPPQLFRLCPPSPLAKPLPPPSLPPLELCDIGCLGINQIPKLLPPLLVLPAVVAGV